MVPNQKPSETVAVLATIDPISQGAGTAGTGWVSVQKFHALMAIVGLGVIGASATLDAKIQQAQDSSGTGAKDITGKAITQLVAAGGNARQALINVRPSDLDTTNNFYYVKLSITVAVAASLINGVILGFYDRFETADADNQAGVVQIVG